MDRGLHFRSVPNLLWYVSNSCNMFYKKVAVQMFVANGIIQNNMLFFAINDKYKMYLTSNNNWNDKFYFEYSPQGLNFDLDLRRTTCISF